MKQDFSRGDRNICLLPTADNPEKKETFEVVYCDSYLEVRNSRRSFYRESYTFIKEDQWKLASDHIHKFIKEKEKDFPLLGKYTDEELKNHPYLRTYSRWTNDRAVSVYPSDGSLNIKNFSIGFWPHFLKIVPEEEAIKTDVFTLKLDGKVLYSNSDKAIVEEFQKEYTEIGLETSVESGVHLSVNPPVFTPPTQISNISLSVVF